MSKRQAAVSRPAAAPKLTVKSGVRAGDIYMHNPRGSN